ncbi:protoglobin domain-containing protein [Methylomonas sp. SURF-2]|uniref:Protoglobin domain-containing protein n=1 Tax=Methylomonas subterranea TaxID=2952225 RepID=A0ABT1TI88_9GAMM|nr:protoglobin domain-containing protein [Methylomonas sp. SURF-2]MCQ8105190.1 protoglobin domain-containing protein [Methylomonas sp. SURF-2]
MTQDFEKLTGYAKQFSGLTPELETLLQQIGGQIKPRLAQVTEDFYGQLATIPQAAAFLEGRIDTLKAAHMRWLESLFSGRYDQAYVEYMYKVGNVHVKVNLPVEFMAGAMTLINNRLIGTLVETYGGDQAHLAKVLEAVSAITGMSLLVMQQSYQEASLAEELEKFLKISGMSRTLFTNLALAYKDK